MGRPDVATILRSTSAASSGGYSQNYATIASVPCRLTTSIYTVPGEQLGAGQLVSVTRWLLNVPPNTDIRPSDRIMVQGETFEVLGGFGAASWNIADTYSLAEIKR
jgi:hypothetical protein